ncbi:MAG: ABC transporter ATP-binding protein [Pseudomonadota bacterium]
MGQIMTLKNVGFTYGSLWALKGIHLDIPAGELVGILGPNGSGKSTLLKIMDGVLVPQEGEVQLKNRALSGFKRSALARKIALVAQETSFRFAFSVLEVVLMGRFPHLTRLQFEGKRDIEVALLALEAMHAVNLAERSIHELSGGEKQRVLIARALAQEPELILLDEPTSFLDIKFKREIYELISSLTSEKGLTVVVVSHDIDLAAQYCHQLVILKDGHLFSIGTPENVVTTSNIETVYDCPVLVDRNPATGSPRVNLVRKALRQKDFNRIQ